MPNLSNRIAGWGGSALMVAAMLATGPAGALASETGAAGAAPASPTPVVLWDQTNAGDTDGGTSASSKFEDNLANYDSQAADDFENTDPAPWEITSVNVHGTYQGPDGSVVQSLLIQIYANNNDQPGQLLLSQTITSGQITGLADGDFTVTLSPSLIVGPGRYWLSAQAYKPDFGGTGRQWNWFEKEDQVLNGSVWQRPSNFLGQNCVTFRPRVDVCNQPTNTDNYDLLFQIIGNAGAANPVPIETSLVPGSRTPAGPTFQLVVGGINFVSGSQVIWNTTTIFTPTTWSGTRLTVTVPSGYIAVSGGVPVKVRNPAPGGGDSNTLDFFIGVRIFLPFVRR